uniref:Ig-like domain-containing protein n=1 Tax=Lates calcarifer TaxID=8187 RepID=A0A4W6FAH8_LATCA
MTCHVTGQRDSTMGLTSALGSVLFVLGLSGICTGFVQENCTNYKLQFERIYSVPGDMAMLNSTLVSPDVFNFTTVPYNITWYDSKTGQEMSNQTGRILVKEETLWFLNVTLDDNGEYVTIVRTPFRCYRQATKLIVDSLTGECGRPRKVDQTLMNGVADTLSCPLKDYMSKLDSYNISSSIKWYKGCEHIVDGTGKYSYRDMTTLMIQRVEPQNNGSYTCTLTFTLGGITGSVSETIDARIREVYSLVPQVREPASEIIKAEIGSSFSKRCLVFVPGVGKPFVSILWIARDKFIRNTQPSDRVYTSQTSFNIQDVPDKGAWLERLLIISELREEDFHINYTCRSYSSRGHPEGYFTLLPADLDGKLYDAYVAYPQRCAVGFSKEVETFALHTLPQVLEKACGYKLFIAGRDCLPGHAVVDSVEENIQASRRLLLVYTASTFTSKRHTSSTSSNNNNHLSKNSNNNENSESKTDDSSSSMSFNGSDEVYQDTRQQLECMAAMHRALVEGSLKVRKQTC